jgi:membrane protein
MAPTGADRHDQCPRPTAAGIALTLTGPPSFLSNRAADTLTGRGGADLPRTRSHCPVVRIARLLRALGRTPRLIRQAVVNAWNDRILGLSAEAAFWQLLSLPSLLIALIATLGYFSRLIGRTTTDRTQTSLEKLFSKAFTPEVVSDLITPILHEVLTGGRPDIISIGFVLALWAGSSATATFVNTITIAYGMRDLRGPIRSRLLALWLFLGSVLVGVILLPLLVLGPTLLTDIVPRGERATAGSVINGSYYPALVALLLLGLTTFYRLAPPRRLPWRRGFPGAVLAMLVFVGGSETLRGYISFILARNHAYGTLAAPVATLLFFFVLALGVLLGAEFNAVIEDEWPSNVRAPRILRPRQWTSLPEEVSEPREDA